MTAEKSNSTNHLLAFVIFFLASFFYVYEFLLRVVPSAVTAELMRDLKIHAGGLGLLTAFFYYTYVPMQIPAGLLFDRFGPRRLLTISLFVCAIGSGFFGLSDSFVLASVGRLLIGFGSAFAFIGALILAARWFDAKYFALLAGILQLMGSFGAIIGGAPIVILSAKIGWHATSLVAAAAGLLFTLLFWLIIKDHPSAKKRRELSHHQKQTQWQRLTYVCKKPQTWWVGAYGLCAWAPVTILAVLWGIPFLMRLYNMGPAPAAGAVAMIWLGVATGSPMTGWLSNVIAKRSPLLILCAAIGLISSITIIYAPTLPLPVMSIFLFCLGFAASGQSLSFAVVQDNNPPSVAGTAVGFNNMAVVLGGLFLQPLIGEILHATWNHVTVNGAPVYSIQNYKVALSMLPLFSLIGLIVSIFFIKETHCKSQFSC